ncbi:putative transcriptional regulator [Photobacterium marinum]|uniref:Putative transcriptional regulator n=1 Tax=Photobacterium marinum TaxID=1056511 RepID=L8JGG1_9GAMM|nr:LysR family transcriptional regulator [Photobacterium marinum]ELR66517.1 putative transcriptional regulator [Photobacterium marinum]
MNKMEWDSIRVFLSVAEEGSMSAAAQVLGVSQPTVSRYICALEEKCGQNLFDRSYNGLTVTAAGANLLASARETARGAESFVRQIKAGSELVEGHVRLAVRELAAYYFIPEAIAAFKREFPLIDVEILVSDQDVNLNKRDADLHLAKEKPYQPDLVVSHLFEGAVGFYAHRMYLAERGEPQTLEELHSGAYQLIGYDFDSKYIDEADRKGKTLDKSNFSFRTDSQKMQVELICAGAGVGVTLQPIAEQYSELIQLVPKADLPPINWWLVCHRDVHVNPRIRSLMTFLCRWFQEKRWSEPSHSSTKAFA